MGLWGHPKALHPESCPGRMAAPLKLIPTSPCAQCSGVFKPCHQMPAALAGASVSPGASLAQDKSAASPWEERGSPQNIPALRTDPMAQGVILPTLPNLSRSGKCGGTQVQTPKQGFAGVLAGGVSLSLAPQTSLNPVQAPFPLILATFLLGR